VKKCTKKITIKQILTKTETKMKRVLMFVFAALVVVAISSCTKEGPQGPAGQNGTDGNATCGQCHNFTDSIVAKIFQYDGSQHSTGSTAFEGNRIDCAPCHASQGFTEAILNDKDTVAAGITEPAPINCRTCHQIHSTYSNADWNLRITSAFTTRIGTSMDLSAAGGSANLCARCHQARIASPWITDPNGQDSLNVTSTRWGPHHGPESELLAGQGCFVIGNAIYESSPHATMAACVTCHGALPAQGDLVGGHTLTMTSDETGDNVAGCKATGCHPAATDFDIDGKQTEIAGMLVTLQDQLAAKGILDPATMLLVKKGNYKQADLAVYWNFQMCEADRSLGVHNYKYMRDVLQAGIDYFASK
jgi:hypothetical protein